MMAKWNLYVQRPCTFEGQKVGEVWASVSPLVGFLRYLVGLHEDWMDPKSGQAVLCGSAKLVTALGKGHRVVLAIQLLWDCPALG